MSTINVTAASNFDMAPDCRTTVHVKKGDKVEVGLSSAQGMIDAGQIKEPSDFAKMLDGVMTKKDDGGSADDDKSVNLSKMNKSELEAHGKKIYGVDLDKRKSKSDMIAEIEALANPEPDADATDEGGEGGETDEGGEETTDA